jgi:hypothetical protein
MWINDDELCSMFKDRHLLLCTGTAQGDVIYSRFACALGKCPQCWHCASMTIQINIRDVPEKVRDELASRAAMQGKSMQEFLRAELERLAARPSIDGSHVSSGFKLGNGDEFTCSKSITPSASAPPIWSVISTVIISPRSMPLSRAAP